MVAKFIHKIESVEPEKDHPMRSEFNFDYFVCYFHQNQMIVNILILLFRGEPLQFTFISFINENNKKFKFFFCTQENIFLLTFREKRELLTEGKKI